MGNLLSSLYSRRFITFRFTENRRHPTDYDSNNRSLGLFHRQKPRREKEAKHAHDTRHIAAGSKQRPLPSAPTDPVGVFRFYRERCHLNPEQTATLPYYFSSSFSQRCGTARRLDSVSSHSQVNSRASLVTQAQGFLAACRFSFSLDVSQTESHSHKSSFFGVVPRVSSTPCLSSAPYAPSIYE
jgi:hypothetical protein